MGFKQGVANLWTYKYYLQHHREITGNSWDCVDYMFDTLVQPKLEYLMGNSEFLELLRKYQVFEKIEGYKYIPDISNEFVSKFTGLGVQSRCLSSGCKAALCIIYFSLQRSDVLYLVDLTEAGPNALTVCLNILSDFENIVGILSIVAEVNAKYWEVSANLNNEFRETWFDIMEQCSLEVNDA